MEASDENNAAHTLGQLFAQERERQGLARAEVAQRLHMSAWQIEALEAGDFARLPKGTFLRGFVRNYAKALGLAADEMLSHLAHSAPSGSAPAIVVPSQNIRFDPLGERLANPYLKAGGFAIVLMAFAFAGLYWWLFIRGAPMAGVAKAPEVTPQNIAAAPLPPPELVSPQPAPALPPALPPAIEPRPEPAKAQPPKSDPAKAQPAKSEPAKAQAAAKPEPPKAAAAKPEAQKPVTPVVATAGARRMKLRFKGESWVEIRDRNGKVLISRLNEPGSETEVAGRPPLEVVIGNAPQVEVTYEGRPFPLEPHTNVAVARFTVE